MWYRVNGVERLRLQSPATTLQSRYWSPLPANMTRFQTVIAEHLLVREVASEFHRLRYGGFNTKAQRTEPTSICKTCRADKGCSWRRTGAAR